MNTIILLDNFSLGGAEKQAIMFGGYLKEKHKHNVIVLAFLPGNGSAKTLCEKYGLKTELIGYFRGTARYLFPLQIINYRKLLNRYNPDILLGYTNMPNLLLGMVWKYTKAKVFIWGQQGIEAAGYDFTKRADRKAIENTPVFVSNSVNGADFLKKQLNIPDEKVKVITNGPVYEAPVYSKEEWFRRLGVGENDFKAVMVAHIAIRKDHETLLYAWKIVRDELAGKNRRAVLVLAGIFGNNVQNLINKAFDLGLIPDVLFLGNVSDIPGLNRAMNLAVLSSNTEGLPNSLLESMYAELPIVGTDIAGIREAVGEENFRYLSQPKNPEDLAEKIMLFAEDEKLCKEVGERNRKRIGDHFDFDNMCLKTYKIIEECTRT